MPLDLADHLVGCDINDLDGIAAEIRLQDSQLRCLLCRRFVEGQRARHETGQDHKTAA
ncbi:hypothetical protein D3C83_275180 [compost metagenome]